MIRRSARVLSRALAPITRTRIESLDPRLALCATVLPSTHELEGTGELLFLRVSFSDATADPQPTGVATMLDSVVDFFDRNSYGKFELDYTAYSPLIELPNTRAFYGSNWDSIASAAKAVAVAAVPAYADIDKVMIRTAPTSYSAGLGGLATGFGGGPNSFTFYSSAEIVAHELGHSIGAYLHAAAVEPGDVNSNLDDLSPVHNPYAREYKDPYDVMGSATLGSDLNIIHKFKSDWLTLDDLEEVTEDSDVIEISPHDTVATTPISGKTYGAVVARDARASYWVEFRQAAGGSLYNTYGVQVRWSNFLIPQVSGETSGGGYDTALLDMNSAPDLVDPTNLTAIYSDVGLLPGRTFTDTIAGVHITNVGVTAGNTGHADIVVKYGQSPHAPVVKFESETLAVAKFNDVALKVSATDSDSDDLAYAWEVEKKIGSALKWEPIIGNSPDLIYSWAADGYYRVRVSVSDMGGNVVTRQIAVKVGSTSPVAGVIKGKVVNADGDPIENAIVSYNPSGASYASASSVTDSAGVYVLPVWSGVTSGVVEAYVPGAQVITTREGNSVSTTNITQPFDFVAVDKAYTITGTVGGIAKAHAEMILKDRTGSTVATTHSLADGTYQFVVSQLGQYSVDGTSADGMDLLDKTVYLDGAAASGVGTMLPARYTVEGEVIGATSSVIINSSYGGTLSDEEFIFTAPAGKYYLRARYSPSTSSLNPTFGGLVTVTSGGVTGLEFEPYSTNLHYISGYAKNNGVPLVNADITLKLGGTTVGSPIKTDDAGCFVFYGLTANNGYTIEASKSGITFDSSTLTVGTFTSSIDSTFTSGLIFNVSHTNAAPAVSSITRTANPDNPRLSLLSASASDDGLSGTLRYDWSVTSGPGTVTFTKDNTGSNATYATFSTAGTYSITVTVTDSSGSTGTTTLSSIVVASYSDTINPNVESYAFAYVYSEQAIYVQFSEDVGASVGAADFVLTNLTTSTVYSGLTLASYDSTSFTAKFTSGTSPSIFPDGEYELTFASTPTISDQSSNALTTDAGFEFFILAGDTDHDGDVDFDDLLTLAQFYNTSENGYSTGNFNYDSGGNADFDDLLLLAQNYGFGFFDEPTVGDPEDDWELALEMVG